MNRDFRLLVVDDERNILYTLSAASTISLRSMVPALVVFDPTVPLHRFKASASRDAATADLVILNRRSHLPETPSIDWLREIRTDWLETDLSGLIKLVPLQVIGQILLRYPMITVGMGIEIPFPVPQRIPIPTRILQGVGHLPMNLFFHRLKSREKTHRGIRFGY